MTSGPTLALVARSQTVQDLVEQCARGELAFSGENSLCSKVAAMGYNTNSLYEAVRYVEDCLNQKGTTS